MRAAGEGSRLRSQREISRWGLVLLNVTVGAALIGGRADRGVRASEAQRL